MPTSPWTSGGDLPLPDEQGAQTPSKGPGSEQRITGPSKFDPSAELSVYSQEPGYVVALAGRYLIHVSITRTTSTTIGAIRRALGDLAEHYETFGYLSVLEQHTTLTLPRDLRESIDAYVRRYSTRFTGAAIVFEGAGFQATVVRSVVTAINLASRASHPSKVFDDLRAGCGWLGHLTPGEPSAARLYELTTQLRKVR